MIAAIVAAAVDVFLRGGAGLVSVVRFAAAGVLFSVPGALLTRWCLREAFGGAAAVPVAFCISSGLFALIGVPMLITHQTIGFYVACCALLVAAFLAAALLRVLRGVRETSPGDGGSRISVLWFPYLVLGCGLAYVSTLKVPQLNDDIWNYLGYVREQLSGGPLGLYDPYFGRKLDVLSRVKINGWLLEQAGLAWISGDDPIVMVLKYLAPCLILVALLAFYGLARNLFGSSSAALFASCLYMLFFASHLGASQLTYGGEFIARIAEDKFATRFLFLPVALSAALAFVESRKRRYLVFFGFLCWVMVAVHPIGLAMLGLCMAGFGAAHLLGNLRSRSSWTSVVMLGVATVSVVAFPLIYLPLTGHSPWSVAVSADINGTPPEVLNNMVFLWDAKKRILVVGKDLYIMHPALALTPAILAGYVIGVPFLLWKVRRGSVPAQMILGALALLTVVLYVPWVATFFVDYIIGPGQLYRLAWPVPLLAFLAMGWALWDLMGRVQSVLSRVESVRGYLGLMPLAVVVALTLCLAPASVAGAKGVWATNRVPLSWGFGYDPVFRWMQHNIRHRSVIMAPDPENIVIPAYSDRLNVVSLRGYPIISHLDGLRRLTHGRIRVPRRDWDDYDFYHGTTVAHAMAILRRYGVDYVLVYSGSGLDGQLSRMKGFTRVSTPSERYTLYRVDLDEIDSGSRQEGFGRSS